MCGAGEMFATHEHVRAGEMFATHEHLRAGGADACAAVGSSRAGRIGDFDAGAPGDVRWISRASAPDFSTEVAEIGEHTERARLWRDAVSP